MAGPPASWITITLHGPQLPSEAPSPLWQVGKWQAVEPYALKPGDDELAALLAYVRNAFDDRATPVVPEQIARRRTW